MGVNVRINGVNYPDVPRIDVPKVSGGGNAPFYDCSGDDATAADVAEGKICHSASGLIVGTASGGGDTFSELTVKGNSTDVITITTDDATRYYTFKGLNGLKYVKFGAGIRSINANAFYGCTNLNSIEGLDVTDVGINAFASCTWLVDVNFPKLDWIQGFKSCMHLQAVSFPVATRFQSDAFNGCTSLTEVRAQNVQRINSQAFYNCSKLVSANYPKAAIIEIYAFYNCALLTEITLDASTSIAAYAFYNCKTLHDLYLTGTAVPTLANINAFNNSPIAMSGTYADSTARIHVRAELEAAFKSATNWSTFASKIVGDYEDD